MDNRLGERLAVHRSVRLIATRPRTASIGQVVNMSRSGACVVGCELPLFSLVQVEFEPLERSSHAKTTIAAYVTRVSDQGIGIEWCEFAPPLVAQLLQTEIDAVDALSERGGTDVPSDTAEAACPAAA